MTIGRVLTLRDGAPAPFTGHALLPEVLAPLDDDALAAHPIRVGREDVPVGELFEITGEPGDALTLRNLPPSPFLGARMTRGVLTLEGDVGDDLGASMTGGMIHVTGDAGQRVAGPDRDRDRGMIGGTILIDGDAGDYAGFRMRRGTVAIAGSAGRSPGYRMVAGTVVVGRGGGDYPGLEMRRGTVILLDAGAEVATGPGFASVGTFHDSAIPALRLVTGHLRELGFDAPAEATWRLSIGDAMQLNKGELWQKVSPA